MAFLVDELSIFLPCFNEEGNLAKTVANVITNAQKYAGKWELIIVNDGSHDKTGAIAADLASKSKNLSVITHKANHGYGAAFKSGLYAAAYSWISFIDADGQFDFAEIKDFLEKQKATNADLVIGYYLKRQVTFLRKLNSFMWQLVVNLLFGLRVRDIDCGFKLIRRKVIETIPKLESERGAFISSEFLIKAQKAGFKIVEIPIHHYPRQKGVATGAKLNVIFKSFVDLFRLWKKLS